MDLLSALLGAVVGLGGGYILGVRQGKVLLRHQRAADVLTEWRRRIHEIVSELAGLKPHKNSADRAKFSENITQKVYELRMYGLNNDVWLDEQAKRKAWQVSDKLKDVTVPLLYDEGMNDTMSSLAFDQAMERAAGEEEHIRRLLDELNEEVGRAIGTARPWWRRWFGGEA